MAKQEPAEDDLPDTIAGEPLDRWLAARCFHYRLSAAYGGKGTPDARFIKLLMRFVEREHPWSRKLTTKELAAKVDFLAVRLPSLRAAISKVAKLEATTQSAVEYAHDTYGHLAAHLDREREALRKEMAADGSEEWVAEQLLRQTSPKRVGRPKKAAAKNGGAEQG